LQRDQIEIGHSTGHPLHHSQSSLNAIAATKAANSAYDELKIAIAAAGHLALLSRQTMYTEPAI
jgi:hypothetical protein